MPAGRSRETLTLKLRKPNRDKRLWLEGMQQSFRDTLATGVETARDASERRSAQSLAYRTARKQGLPGAYARMAADRVLSILRHPDQPVSPQAGFGLASQAFQVQANASGWVLRVSTGNWGRFLWFPLHVTEHFSERREWIAGDAWLFPRRGEWFVRFSIHRPPVMLPRMEAEQTFIGIDLGVVRLVTLAAPGRVWIFKGLSLRARRQRVTERCRELAVQGKDDLARKLRSREQRWMTAVNHQVSRRVVDLTGQYPRPVLALERLAGLRRKDQQYPRANSLLEAWDFRQLLDFIAYKAQAAGIPVRLVDPRGTTNTCLKCRHNSSANILRPGAFCCTRCGYRSNADLVAARNIARKAAEGKG